MPFLAILVAIPIAWGGWLGWLDLAIATGMYLISGLGITVGLPSSFHPPSVQGQPRHARLRLAVAGSLAIEGPVIRWVADHRKHHKYSDKDGDPHSPWRYGETIPALMKGLFYAHMGWMFDVEQTNQKQYAPDLLKDDDIRRISKAFPWLTVISVLLPAVLGGLLTWSWQGAVTGFFWGTLVRVGLLHHVTWSINSICHAVGERPVREPRQVRQRVVARVAVDGRVLAQPPPRRSDLCPSRRPQGADRRQRAGHLGVGEAGLGVGRPLAERGPDPGQAASTTTAARKHSSRPDGAPAGADA